MSFPLLPRWLRPISAVPAIVLAAAALSWAPLAGAAPAMPLEAYEVGSYDLGGDFALTDQHGKTRRLSDFAGKVVLLAFGYTFCPDVCPLTLQDFATVREGLGDSGKDLQGVFVSLDPGRDTPARLKTYLAHFDPTFVGFTGSEDALRTVADKYNARFRIRNVASKVGYVVDHTALTYLIDRQGRVRYLFPFDVGPDVLAEGVRHLLDEHP